MNDYDRYDYTITAAQLEKAATEYGKPIYIIINGEYYEYKAHANVVRDTSEEMARKWEELWGYYVKILIALVVLLMFSSALGILGIIAALIVLILFVVVCIVKFVYVYETGKLFQGVAERKE